MLAQLVIVAAVSSYPQEVLDVFVPDYIANYGEPILSLSLSLCCI